MILSSISEDEIVVVKEGPVSKSSCTAHREDSLTGAVLADDEDWLELGSEFVVVGKVPRNC